MQISEVMSKKVVTVRPSETASAAWSRMQLQGIRHLIVMEKGDLVGVISDRDLGGKNGERFRKNQAVAELMTEKVASVTPKMTLRQAANLMRGRSIGCLPVLERNHVVGVLTATDILDELGRGSTQLKKSAGRSTSNSSLPDKEAREAKAEQNRMEKGPTPTGRNNPNLGRDRHREPDSPKRLPLSMQLPKPSKTGRSLDMAMPVSAYIRGPDLDQTGRAYLRRKLGLKLGKYAKFIERVSVRVEDLNGPRGGRDQVCRIKVVLRYLPSIVVEHRSDVLQSAMDGALSQVERAVRRATERRQMKRRNTKVAMGLIH